MNKQKKLVYGLLFLIGLCFSANAFALSMDSLLNIFQRDKAPKRHQVVTHSGPAHLQPAQVNLGVYVLHVGKYDLQSASTRIDFYLIFRCKPACNDINFEIMNATSWNKQLVAKQKGYLIYRVQADINKSGNLRNYPFDNHTLDIVIENRQLTSDKMVFEADPSMTALDSNLNVVGFTLSPTWSSQVTNHYYSVFQQGYSSYKFSMYIHRPAIAGILKGILPALIIICCNFLALFMKIENLSQRLGIATSTLIAAEVFHLNLTSSIPPLGYVTFADMFMLINYIVLLTVLAEVILTTYFLETKHKPVAQRINELAAWAIPLAWLSMQLINWFAFGPGS